MVIKDKRGQKRLRIKPGNPDMKIRRETRRKLDEGNDKKDRR